MVQDTKGKGDGSDLENRLAKLNLNSTPKPKPTPAEVLSINNGGAGGGRGGGDPSPTFESMNLSPDLLKGIYAQGMEKPSEVQKRGIVPCIKGQDAIIQGQSGMGKTACFVIASVARLQSELKINLKARPAPGCLTLVLAPTRELAKQIHGVYQAIGEKLGLQAYNCTGGEKTLGQNRDRLTRGAHVIVGTPGRILHLIEEGYIKPTAVKILILDEADQMLEKMRSKKGNVSYNFKFRDVGNILTMFSKRRGQGSNSTTQVILTSATFDKDIVFVSRPFMVNPLTILVRSEELTLEGIEQFHVQLDKPENKMLTFLDIYQNVKTIPTIVFCTSRKRVESLVQQLEVANGPKILAVHGEMSQDRRNKILNKFRTGQSKILISSDLFGRGIDIQQVQLVINYDFPPNTTQYIHRVGRSGRFGRTGVALTFIASEKEQGLLKSIEEYYHTAIGPMPQDLLKYFK